MFARELAEVCNSHPADLLELDARIAAPVMPGDTINIAAALDTQGDVKFEATVNDVAVLKAGHAKFKNPS